MTPEVLEGAREPRAARTAAAAEQAAKRGPGGIQAIPEGKRVYMFKGSKYRLQLTAPEETKLSDGRIKRDKAICVVASENFAILDKVKDARAIELLEEHPDFGVDFWDFASKIAEAQEAKVANVVSVLKDPAARAAIIAALAASESEDFEIVEA